MQSQVDAPNRKQFLVCRVPVLIAAMSQQPRRSGRRRTLSKRLQDSHNLSIAASVVSHPRPHVPPIPKLPAAPPPPPPPRPLPATSESVHIAYSSSVCKVMQRVHTSDVIPTDSLEPTAGPVKAPKLRKRQRSPVLREPPSLFHPPDWSRITVPPVKASANEPSRTESITLPFAGLPIGDTLPSTPRTAAKNVTHTTTEACGSEEESQGSYDHTVPSWHKTRRPRSTPPPPTNNCTSYSPTFPTPSVANSSLQSSRKFYFLLNSESTSESSLTPATGSNRAASMMWNDFSGNSKDTENEVDSEPDASRSEPSINRDENIQQAEDQDNVGSVDCSEESIGSNSRHFSPMDRIESEKTRSVPVENARISNASMNNIKREKTALDGIWDYSIACSGTDMSFREPSKSTSGEVSGSATDEVDDMDVFDMFLQERKLDCWYRNCSSLDPIEVRVTELAEFLYKHQPDLWINPALELLSEYTPAILSETELKLWSDDRRTQMNDRRVMMWDISNRRLLPFEQSPLFSNLSKVLQTDTTFEVLSLKSLSHLKRSNRIAVAQSSDCTNSKVAISADGTSRASPVLRDHLNSTREDVGASPELMSKFLSNETNQKNTSSDNSTDTQPDSMNDEVVRTPEFQRTKGSNPPNLLNMNTRELGTTQSEMETPHPSSGAATQTADGGKHGSTGTISPSSSSTESPKDCDMKTCGKRKNADTSEVSNPPKKLKTSVSKQHDESASIGHLKSTSQVQTGVETSDSLNVTASVKERNSPSTGSSVLLRLRIRPERKSTRLRLRIRPQKLSPKSYSIMKPKFESRFYPVKGTYFKSVVFHKIIARLRYCGLHDHNAWKSMKDPTKSYVFPSPILWDTKKLKKVDNVKVPECNQDVFKDALLFNPQYEPYTGQDLVLKVGEKDHVQLIQVSERTPAVFVKFWNRKKRKIQRHDKNKGVKLTVGDVCKSFKYLEMYIGQDYRGNPAYRALRATATMYSRRGLGLVEQYWVLAKRPIIVTELVMNGWTPKMVSVHHQLASKTVFWDRMKGCLHLTKGSEEISLAEYLEGRESRFEPYTGQDLEFEDRIALDPWKNILKWGPGCRLGDMVFVLDGIDAARRELGGHRRKTIPRCRNRVLVGGRAQSVNAKRRMTLSEKRDKRRERDRKRRERKKLEQIREAEEAANRPEQETMSDVVEKMDVNVELPRVQEKSERTAKRLGSSEEVDNLNEEGGPKMDKFNGFPVSSQRAAELKKLGQNATVLVRHKQLQLVLPMDQSPLMKDLPMFLELNNEYELFDIYRHSVVTDESGKYLMPRLLAKRQVNHIRQVVSTLMLGTVQGNSLEKIRGYVEEELSVCGDFENLLKSMADGESVTIALELLSLLEKLDVFDFFSFVEGENSSTSDDLSSIRSNLESGEMCLAHDVMLAFRKVCAAQIQHHFQHKVMHEAAVTMFAKGEQTFAYFYDEHHASMKRDRHLYRIRDLANRAQTEIKAQKWSRVDNIGFGLSNIVQRNAFMNFRDETGNSIMSQGVSSRVLGILVDDQPGCLDTIKGRGHWKIDNVCHLCGREVNQPYNEALPCANRLFSECSRIVCRVCLLRKDKDPLEFLNLRSRGDWICVHCSGLCKKTKRSCTRKEIPTKDTPVKDVEFAFDCRFTDWDSSKEIRAVFERRQIDGKTFEVVGGAAGSTGAFDDGENTRLWRCKAVLPIGFYHVKMCVGGSYKASTVLYVFPPRSFEQDSSNKSSVNGIASQHQYCGKPGGRPTVYWKASGSLGDKVATSLRGNPIHRCSRTEGYDWTAAKRHAMQLFKPDIVGEVPAQLTTCIATNYLPRIPVNDEQKALKEMDSHEELFHRIMREEGKSYKEYECALNTKLFEKMQRESLWGLVVARSRIHGSGLFSLSGFGTGDFIVEYAGELIRSPLADVREPRYDEDGFGSYMFRVDESHVVDATIRSNRARFVNHSCDPNMESAVVTANGRKLVVFRAKRPIPPFSELTFDYQLPLEDKKMKCLCKAWNCTGVMN